MPIASIDRERKVAITDTGQEVPLPPEALQRLAETDKSPGFEERKARTKRHYQKDALGAGTELGKQVRAAQGGVLSTSMLSIPDALMDVGGALAASYNTNIPSQKDMSFYDRFSENYGAIREGTREVREEAGEEYPKTRMAGMGAGFVGDVGMIGKLAKVGGAVGNVFSKGQYAAPVMGAGLSETNPFEDPMTFMGERALDSVVGFALDKAVQTFAKSAAKRQASQEHKLAQAEFQNIVSEYQDALRKLPAEQQAARKSFSQGLQEQIGRLGREMSVDTIPRGSLAVDEFINGSVGASRLAGTREGDNIARFLKASVDSRPENMNWRDLGNILKAVEDRISLAGEAELPILLDFKNHLSEVVPKAVGQSAAYRKYSTRIRNDLIKGVERSVNQMVADPAALAEVNKVFGSGGQDVFKSRLRNEVRQFVQNLPPEEFNYLMQSGEMGGAVQRVVEESPVMQMFRESFDLDPSRLGIQEGSRRGSLDSSTIRNIMNLRDTPHTQGLRQASERFSENVAERASSTVDKFLNDVLIESSDRANKVSRRLSKIQGVADPLPTPVAPQEPVAPEMDFLANIGELPMNQFVPSMKTGTLGKVGGIAALGYGAKNNPMAAGALAGGVGASTALLGATKALTSPTSLGDVTRLGVKQLSKALPRYLESKFESYSNGVIQDPNERLSATFEIENDPYLNNEEKAVWQTKINSGQRLE